MLLATSVMMALSLAESFSLTAPCRREGGAQSTPRRTPPPRPHRPHAQAPRPDGPSSWRRSDRRSSSPGSKPRILSRRRSSFRNRAQTRRLVGVRLSLGQTGLHATLLDHYPVRELILEARRFETLNLAVLNRKTAKEVVELHSLNGSNCLLVDTALRSNPEVNMLLVRILVKVEIAIALVELAFLTFRHRLQLQLFNPPESPQVVTSLVHEALKAGVD